ncbi:hypothetical protein K466DRAFT_496109 [Polyporus arcularius HHB13444]|uniref:C2H2-type domain-containing protein n=1 Tax=Polyporus arcularius HHB13444 TaxID=1314778 RepID=A0A5C3P628_9APHY|nr:hypothetical protein K466DRAFT_496109 [Polyporus arcularius HHB13444]
MARYCRLCKYTFGTLRVYQAHRREVHEYPRPLLAVWRKREHKKLDARKCDINGNFIPHWAAPPPLPDDIDWSPFPDRPSFEFAELVYEESHLSNGKISKLLRILAAKHVVDGLPEYDPIYKQHKALLEAIDSIEYGEANWKAFAVRYSGPITPNSPAWKRETFIVHARNTLRVAEIIAACPDFDGKFDYIPYEEYLSEDCRRVSNLMSGQWAWKQAIAEDPATRGSMLLPIVLGADKTTVSVATGNQEFHPLYMSIGNLHNNVRRAHRDSVVPVAFLAIPKSAREWEGDEEFRIFKKLLYHTSIAKILEPLRPGMTTPHVLRCPDGHFRRAIFEIGPFIADYPEQVYLSGVVSGWCPKCFAIPDRVFVAGDARSRATTADKKATYSFEEQWDVFGINPDVEPFTNYFPRADIHELLTPDLLHQLIKGTFKDHLVTWVFDYIKATAENEREANKIIDDIDRRINATPPFPGLRRFPQGRNFKQWTGDDSKALMKVFLPAIVGYVPDKMVRCIAALLDFCYIARRSTHDSHSLAAMEHLLARFEGLRDIFEEAGVRVDTHEGFALPRQHALFHYVRNIQLFGSPNGLCSSITESKHISAVKVPWRASSRHNALGQIIRTITRSNKIAAARAEFGRRRMLSGDVLTYSRMLMRHLNRGDSDGSDSDSDPDSSTSSETIDKVARALDQPSLVAHLRRFLQSQRDPDGPNPDLIPLDECPYVWSGESIEVYHSATATFYAPSELAGPGGMHREMIRATPRWWGLHPRFDTVLVSLDRDALGMDGMTVARVRCFFTYRDEDVVHECALVEWFILDQPDPDDVTGMWIVRPDVHADGTRVTDVISVDSILRAGHLAPVYGTTPLPHDFRYADALDAFRRYYVNWYIDYHAHETIC